MQTRFYDSEESFSALILILTKNNIRYIKQKAFDKYLLFVKEYLGKKYNINCEFFGSSKFKDFTEYSKNKCASFNVNDDFVIIRNQNEIELKERIFHKKMLESASCEECLSVFGLSSSKELNKANFCNDISKKEKDIIAEYYPEYNKNIQIEQ